MLRAARGMKMRSAAYHHVKSLDLQVLSEVKSVQENILQAIDSHTI